MRLTTTDRALAASFAGSLERTPARRSVAELTAADLAVTDRPFLDCQFLIAGQRYTRAAMLEANAGDEDCCAWLRLAKPGDVYEQMHSEPVRCL